MQNNGQFLLMDKQLNILVVDDEENIREIFKEYLESVNSYNVLTAKDGFEALDIIKSEDVHCCFTDISMPRMDGIELTKKIQHYDNTIPVVVMTGYPSLDSTIKILKNGVVDFLPKPVKIEQLPITVERVTRERSLFIENVLLAAAEYTGNMDSGKKQLSASQLSSNDFLISLSCFR